MKNESYSLKSDYIKRLNEKLECGSIDQKDYNSFLDETNNFAVIKNNKASMSQVCSTIAGYKTLDELAEKSNAVVRARFVDKTDSFEIKPVFGDSTQEFADYHFIVSNVLKGNIDNSNNMIDVRVRSNENQLFDKKDDLYLFLYKPDMGSGYNTKGNYYYLTGTNQGIFRLQDGLLLNDNGISVPVSNFEGVVKYHDESDEFFSLKEQFLSNLKENLESGFIGQNEYERLLKETEDYAVIIEK